MIPGPGAPIFLPLLLLLGAYFLDDSVWRGLCYAGLIAWILIYSGLAIHSRQWALLAFPGLVLMLWCVVAEVKQMTK